MEYRIYFGLLLLIIFLLLIIILYISKNNNERREQQRTVPGTSKVEPITLTVPVVIDIVGKTTTVMKEPVAQNTEPAPQPEFIPLEMIPPCETDPELSPDDFENNLGNTGKEQGEDPEEPEEIVIFIDKDYSDDFSQALTFEQINQAIDVVKGDIDDEENQIMAGETLYNMPPNILEAITVHENNSFIVGKLIDSFLNHPNSRRISRPIVDFDIAKYI